MTTFHDVLGGRIMNWKPGLGLPGWEGVGRRREIFGFFRTGYNVGHEILLSPGIQREHSGNAADYI
jgi:hypothetical protein